MGNKLLYKILDDVIDLQPPALVLSGMCEPLLDNRVKSICTYVSSRVKKTEITVITNGSRLDESLLNCGIRVISISLDAASEESYRKIHPPLNFNDTVRRLRKFMQTRDDLGLKFPLLNINFTIQEANKDEQEKFREYWNPYLNPELDSINVTLVRSWLETFEDTVNHWPARLPYCERILDCLQILSDGRCSMCCLDYDGEVILGNLKSQSIREVWLGPEHRKIIDLHKARTPPEMCLHCDYVAW